MWTRLGEIANIGAGNPAPQGEEFFENGIYPFVRVQDMGNLGSNVYIYDTRDHLNIKAIEKMKLFPKGSVLFTKSGMSILLNQRAILGKDMYVVSHIGIALPLGDIPCEWLYYWLKTFDFKKLTHATTLPSLQLSKVQEIYTPLPPLPEQRRIVAKIEELFTRLDAGVSALKKTQAQLKRYRQSVLKAACEGKLVLTEAELAKAEGRTYEPADVLLARILEERREKWNGKGKYKEPVAPDTSGLPTLPEGWGWATLPQLGDLARGKSKHRPRDDKRLFGGPYPFIQTGDVKNSNGSIKNFSQTYSEFGLAQSRLWPAGTLCITIAANIADSGILTFPSCFPDSVVGFVCEDTNCNVRFIEFFIRTAKKDLEKYAPATAQKNINLETLGNLAVPLPPLAEQRRIVAEVERRLSVADEVAKTVKQSLAQAERLRQSILKKAFEGKLVAQDANDEPAGVLLERIKAERTKKGSGSKFKRKGL